MNPPRPTHPHPAITMGEVSWGLFCPYVVCVVFIARVLRRDLQSNSLTWSALQAYSDSQSHPVAARQAGRVIGSTDLYSNDLYEKRWFWIGGEHSRTRPYFILLDPEKAIEFFLHGDGFQMFSSWDSQHLTIIFSVWWCQAEPGSAESRNAQSDAVSAAWSG